MNPMVTQQDKPEPSTPTGHRLWAAVLTVAGVLMRLVSHPWQLTPAGGAGLFSGARLPLPQALLATLGTYLAVDVFLAATTRWPFFHSAMPFVYGCLAVNVLIGRWLLGRSRSPLRIGAAAVLAAVQFFLVTNFGVWLTSVLNPSAALAIYPPTFAGLVECYTAALPFFRNTLVGDLVSSGVLFGAFALLTARAPAPAAETVQDKV